MKRAIDADDVLKLIVRYPGIGYACLCDLSGSRLNPITGACRELRATGRIKVAKKNVGGKVIAKFYTPQAWLAEEMRAERAAGFPPEKTPPPPKSGGITAEDMAWMERYRRRYFARMERVRGLSA